MKRQPLRLNKETVRALAADRMRLAVGGVACPETIWEPTCAGTK